MPWRIFRSLRRQTLPAPERVPRHVAIIMDGNGRWAKRRGMPRSAGHRVGVDRVEEMVRACLELGIRVLTLYAFSTENWRRSPDEIDQLMKLFAEALEVQGPKLHRQGVRLRFIGRRDRLPRELVESIRKREEETAANDRLTLCLAVDYGARDEITRAARCIARRAAKGELDPEALGEEDFGACLYTADLPDPDLIIRPSGEYRLSNFLLWQAAYAELWFTPTLWPDFGPEQLLEGLRAYARRERRYGGAE